MRVKYVGLRPNHKDGLYDTGAWVKDQVKDVPAEVAEKMFRHGDVYEADTSAVDGSVIVAGGVAADPDYTYVLETLAEVKVAFLDAVLEAGAHELEAVEALGVLFDAAVLAMAKAPVEKVEVEEKKQENEEDLQDARDLVATMEKDGLDNFAATHFKVKLHHNMNVENARAKVIALIDQYGMS